MGPTSRAVQRENHYPGSDINSDPITGKSTPEDWHFSTLAQVWDHQTKAIIAGADKLEALSPADRTRSLAVLGEQVRSHIRGLDDSWLVATALFMVEDLYKSYFDGFRWSSGVADYIAGTAGVFMREFTPARIRTELRHRQHRIGSRSRRDAYICARTFHSGGPTGRGATAYGAGDHGADGSSIKRCRCNTVQN